MEAFTRRLNTLRKSVACQKIWRGKNGKFLASDELQSVVDGEETHPKVPWSFGLGGRVSCAGLGAVLRVNELQVRKTSASCHFHLSEQAM